MFCFFFQAEDGIRDVAVTGVQTCALPIFGYGRDWRTGVYMDVGGKDAKDAWMGGNYLKSLPYVDANRIGVWGLSYGGFFTLIAMTDQPRSEEHTSELQSRLHLVCRLLLEKKKKPTPTCTRLEA